MRRSRMIGSIAELRPLAIGLATVLLGASGCRPPQHPPPPAIAPVALGAAVLSVYFYANFSSSTWLPEELRPIDLDVAARTIADAGPRAEPKRRRAIAWLAATGLHDPRRRQALQILGAPLGALDEQLDNAAASAAPPTPPAGVHVAGDVAVSTSATVGIYVQQRVTAALVLLDHLWGPAISGCPGDVTLPVDIQKDPTTSATTATVHVSVQRDYSTVCSAMDPQAWDTCSVFFKKTYVAQKVGDGYAINVDCSVDEDPNPPAACGPYTCVLYENFEIAFKSSSTKTVTTAWYKQLLDITSSDLTSTSFNPVVGHEYDYKLFNAICSQVYGDTRPGGLAINRGYVKIQQRTSDPSWTDIELAKTVLFSGRPLLDPLLNLWAGITLQAMADELYEMACCSPP
jgi:hypothetical protein